MQLILIQQIRLQLCNKDSEDLNPLVNLFLKLLIDGFFQNQPDYGNGIKRQPEKLRI
jgi:hypothetical protein